MRIQGLSYLSMVLVVIALATGCASGGKPFSSFNKSPLDAAKKPEVLVAGVSRQQIIDALTTRMVSDGWQLTSTQDAKAVYHVSGRRAVGFLTDVPSEVEERSSYRLTCAFTNVQGGIRVVGALEIATDSDRESPTYQELITWDARSKVQKILDAAKSFAPNFPVSQVTKPE